MGVLALQSESQFAKRYSEGIHKSVYWEVIYEDVLTLIARV
jgi:citrate synthase